MSVENYPWVLLALVLWREARGCTTEEKLAIAHVIVNRVTDPAKRWPSNLVGVITQPLQFTSIVPPMSMSTAELRNAVSWPSMTDQAFAECCQISDSFGLGKESADPTLGATNYYSDPIIKVPAWADPSKLTVKIGVFHFYKL